MSLIRKPLNRRSILRAGALGGAALATPTISPAAHGLPVISTNRQALKSFWASTFRRPAHMPTKGQTNCVPISLPSST